MTTEQQCSDRRSELYDMTHGKVSWKVFAWALGILLPVVGFLLWVVYGTAMEAGHHAQNNEVAVARIEQKVDTIHEEQKEMKGDIKQILQSVKD